MIHIGLADDGMTLSGNTLNGTAEPRLVVVLTPGGPWPSAFLHAFVTTHEKIESGEEIEVVCVERLEDPTTGIIYKLVPQENPDAKE